MCCAAIGGSGCALSWRHTGTDGAVIMVEWHGYGRACPPGRRQIVGAVFHLADREPYRRLNDAVCVRDILSCPGEQVRILKAHWAPALARVVPDRVGQSWLSALRMPVCACRPSRSKAGLSSGARRRDGPLKVNSAV